MTFVRRNITIIYGGENKMNQKFNAILTKVVEDQKQMKSQTPKLTRALTVHE